MSNPTDANQASEDMVNEILEDLVYDIPNSYGYPPDFDPDFARAKRNLKALIRTEKLKLLVEVRERVVGEDENMTELEPYGDRYSTVCDRNALRSEQLELLTKLEAEL